MGGKKPMRLAQLASRLRRLAKRVLQEFGLLPPASDSTHTIRLVQCNDLLLLLDPIQVVDHPHSQVVERTIIETGNWEAEQQNFLLATARTLISELAREAIFIDIGAYFGLYALRMARSGLFHRIIAIEGDRCNYSHLRANVFINALDRKIDCLEIAVSDSVWDMYFRHSEASPVGNRGGVGHTEHDLHLAEKKKTVPIDDVVSASGSLIVTKIDVEGHELRVIRGMRRLIENNSVLLQVECVESAVDSHEQFLTSVGLRRINRISIDSYWTNIPGLYAH
jgi:FkbM family methyltransferase